MKIKWRQLWKILNKNVEELFNPNLSQMYNDKFQELIFRMDNAYANYRVKVLKEEIGNTKSICRE